MGTINVSVVDFLIYLGKIDLKGKTFSIIYVGEKSVNANFSVQLIRFAARSFAITNLYAFV